MRSTFIMSIKFALSATNIGTRVQDAERAPKRRYYDLATAPDKTADGFIDLAKMLSNNFSYKYKGMPKEMQEFAIFREIATAPIETVLPKIPKSNRKHFLELRNSKNQSEKELEATMKSDPDVIKSYILLTSLKKQYAEFVDENRPEPSMVLDKHPDNMRILGAVSQTEPAAAANNKKGEKVDWFTKKFSTALRANETVDEAMDKASKKAVVTGYSDGQPPIIQKPVSTKRENKTAWRKSDNNNLNVKRIAIFIVTEDGSKNFKNNADEIRTNFYIPDEKSKSNPFERRFRVDGIITVTPPTEEEITQGITQADKIRQAFEQGKQFMDNQKALARKKAEEEGSDPEKAAGALRFEGMANWFGHGTIVEDKSPKKGDPRYFQEGTAEFKFITNPLEQKGIEESEIKRMEQNVKDYTYFTQYFNSCHSGAIIN